MVLASEQVAFWNVNIPTDQHTADCPAFLQYCFSDRGAKDRQIIGTPDSAYRRLTWHEVRNNAANNRPDLFQRTPSELRKYRHFCHQLERNYGTILEFIVKERLKWTDVTPTADCFEDGHYKILYNDWPYGIDKRIVHLVVWTKFPMIEDPKTGMLVPEMQQKVDDFVNSVFTKHCGQENVAWFRNWTSLKSVHAVEHIHVMLFAPQQAYIAELTDGDEPLAVKLGHIPA